MNRRTGFPKERRIVLRLKPSAKESRTPFGVRFSFFDIVIEDSRPAANAAGFAHSARRSTSLLVRRGASYISLVKRQMASYADMLLYSLKMISATESVLPPSKTPVASFPRVTKHLYRLGTLLCSCQQPAELYIAQGRGACCYSYVQHSLVQMTIKRSKVAC